MDLYAVDSKQARQVVEASQNHRHSRRSLSLMYSNWSDRMSYLSAPYAIHLIIVLCLHDLILNCFKCDFRSRKSHGQIYSWSLFTFLQPVVLFSVNPHSHT